MDEFPGQIVNMSDSLIQVFFHACFLVVFFSCKSRSLLKSKNFKSVTQNFGSFRRKTTNWLSQTWSPPPHTPNLKKVKRNSMKVSQDLTTKKETDAVKPTV